MQTRIPDAIITALLLAAAALTAAGAGTIAHAQQTSHGTKAAEQMQRAREAKAPRAQDGAENTLLGIKDRAGGLHTRSNIGWFFENRGKLYERRASQGLAGEWPIGSGHEYVYRVNPIVAIPGNAIQGRFTTDEEWEACYGYNNADSARVAFSDNPRTWPATGWPGKDASGKPVFVSNQDSYCAYNDSNNTRKILGIQINQIGYAFSQKKVRDMIFYTFLVINKSTQAYDKFYFGIYADMDIGNLSGGVEEWRDDKFDYDPARQLITYYDAKGYSTEWLTPTGQNSPTGYIGMTVLETPTVNGKQVGVTDLHYNTEGADDDLDVDTVMYGILSSAPGLYQSNLSSRYFHLGARAPNLHFDDINTIPAGGMDVTTWLGSGPYRIGPGDTLRFVTAWVAGFTPAEYDSAYAHCRELYESGFQITQPPAAPKVTAVPGDRRVTITWDNAAEGAHDLLSGRYNFEGYRLYKSIDRGLHWDQVDRNSFPTAGADPIPLAEFDRVDGIGKDRGLQYRYVDTALTNGFEYWYSVTAYSVGSSGQIIESARGNTTEEQNIGAAVPRWSATARTPVAAGTVTQTGTGKARVSITVTPADVPEAGGRSYEISFAPMALAQQGNFLTVMNVTQDSVSGLPFHRYSLTFVTPATARLRDLTSGAVLDPAVAYTSGQPILFDGIRLTLTDTSSQATDRPVAGDSIVIVPAITVTSGTERLLASHPFTYGTSYVTANQVGITVTAADTAASSQLSYRDRFSFTTAAAKEDAGAGATVLSRVKVVPNPYMVSSQYEREYGSLRREPIRQLRFTNLPSRCTIYIFTLDGDKVQTIQHDRADGTEVWDMRAAGGREIAAGVYLYLVKTDTAEKLDRFAVIK